MNHRRTTAALAAILATLAASTLSRADEPVDAWKLLGDSFEQQTGESLPAEDHRNALKAWQACERRGVARTADPAPRGALVFYHTPYGHHGRLAVSKGDGTVVVGHDETVAIDAIPGRLGWVEGPRCADAATASVSSATGLSKPASAGGAAAGTTPETTSGMRPLPLDPSAQGGSTPAGTAPVRSTATAVDGLPGTALPGPVAGGPTTSPAKPDGSKPSPSPGAGSGSPTNGSGPQQGSSPVSNNGGSPSSGGGSPSSGGGSPSSGGGSPSSGGGSPSSGGGNPSNGGGSPSQGFSQPDAVKPDPNFKPTAGSSFVAKGTGYYPANNSMEGGFKDRKGKPLSTLQDYLANRTPFVSVAMDANAFPYGTKLRIKELEEKYGREIDFRVVDTGGAFRGKGTTRIDICTGGSQASHDGTVNGMLHCQVMK